MIGIGNIALGFLSGAARVPEKRIPSWSPEMYRAHQDIYSLANELKVTPAMASTILAGRQLILSQCRSAETAPSLAHVATAPTVSPANAIRPDMP